MNRSVHRLYYVALGGGALLWLGTALFGGRREAWDSPLYWSIAYPLCLLLAGALAYVELRSEQSDSMIRACGGAGTARDLRA